jgi:hypothetical protein
LQALQQERGNLALADISHDSAHIGCCLSSSVSTLLRWAGRSSLSSLLSEPSLPARGFQAVASGGGRRAPAVGHP